MADIKIRWTLDLVDRGVGAKLLREDRAIRSSLVETDAQYRKTGATAASVSARQAEAANRNATATRAEGAAQVVASDEVRRYAAAQAEALSVTSKILEQSAAIEGAYKRQGRAARKAADETSLAARVRSRTSRAGGAVLGAGAAVGGAIRNAASSAGIGVGLAGFAGLAVAAKETISFDRALRNVNSIAQLSEKQLQSVGKALRELGGKTAQAPKTLAEGMYDLVSSGFNAKDSLTIVGAAARAATAGLSTTDVSTKAVAAVLNAYHLAASKASAVSDTLFQTVNLGVITFGELAEHIGTVLPFASSLGVNLGEVGAAISTLTKQGIKGELAVTFLKNAMTAFLKPGVAMAKAIKATGAASGEALVKHLGFEGALRRVIGATDGTKGSIAKLFPNIRSLTAVLGLTGKNAKTAASDLKGFEHDTGATSKALSQQAQSISYQWKKLKAEASSLAIGLGDKLVPAANKVLGVLTKIGDKKTVAGGAVASLFGGISAGVTGKLGVGPKTGVRTQQFVSGLPTLRPGPWAPGRTAPFAQTTQPLHGEPSTLSKIGAAIGGAARTIGKGAVEAGKELLDAFKPALPFLQNVLLPLLLGIGKGVLGGIVVAFKILVPVIKILATGLGWLGTILKPFKGVFEDIGIVIGFVAGGPILKALEGLGKLGIVFKVLGAPIKLVTGLFGLVGKAIGKIPGALGLIGKGLAAAGNLFGKLPGKIGSFAGSVLGAAGKLATSAGKGLASLPVKLAVNAYSAGRAVIDKLGEWVGKAGGVAGKIVGAIIKPIGSLAGKVAGLAGDVLGAFSSLGKQIVEAIVKAIVGAPNAIIEAVKSLIPGPIKGILGKAKGLAEGAFKELFGRRGGRLGPTGFRRYQAGGMVDAFVSPGERVVYGNSSWTVPGAPVAADSVFAQLPVGAAVLTGDGQARIAAGASLGEALALQAPHFNVGGVVRGRVSTFGPPSEAPGPTASGVSSSSRGVAIRPGATWQSGKATLGQYWSIQIGSHTGTLKQIDLGPNQSTGRRIDVTGAGAKYLGIDPKNFPTDSTGTATLLGKSRKGGSTSGVSINLPIHLGRSRTRSGLVSDALNQGVEAGAAGLTRTEINRAYRGVRGAQANPIIAAIAQAQTATTRKITIGGTHTSKKGGLVDPSARWNPSHLRIANWIAPFLSWAAGHGWGGSITSGYRSKAEQTRIWNSGVRPAARPGTSNHEGTTFPSGAVDVSAAAQLASVLSKRPGPHLLQWAGSKDPVHFSYPHNGGYRRGGIIRYRKGGPVGLKGRLAEATTFKGGSWQHLDEAIGNALENRLETLRATVQKTVHAGGDKKTIQRLQGVISLIDFEIGRRIGAIGARITKRSAGLEHGQNVLDRSLRRAGIEPESVQGITIQSTEDRHAEGVRQKNVKAAKDALKRAKRTGDRQLVAQATEQLGQAEEDLDEAITKRIEDRRNLLRVAAQNQVDSAQFGIESAQNALQGLDISQRLTRTNETPGGLTQKASAIQSQLLPALQGSLAALNNQLGVDQSLGDTTGARQVLLQIQQAGNEIGSAMAEAAELIRQAAEQTAQETVDRAAHVTSMAQLGQQHLELEERIAGTYDASGQTRADYINSQIIPAIQAEIGALVNQEKVAKEQGDQKLAEQIGEQVAGKQNDLLQEQLDAMEQVAENTSQKKVGGTLGFTYGGEDVTDALISVGTGS